MAAAVVQGASLIFLPSWTDEVQSKRPNLQTFEPRRVRAARRGLALLGGLRMGTLQ